MRITVFIALLVSVLLISCQSKYQKLLKSSDYEKQYEVAVEKFNEGDYFKSLQLFEGLISVYRGSTKGENSLYYLARCNFELEDFMLAGYYFKSFATTYPNSDRIEETQYYAALSYFYESPKPSLDQEYTKKAIDEFQIYINQFSDSKKVDSCNHYIGLLREKLENKAYDIAKLYVKIGEYKAATIELSNFLSTFPDSKFREEVMFLLVQSGYDLASNSVRAKQIERYEDAINNYYNYIDEFPTGEHAKDAERIYTMCKKVIDKY